MYVATAHRYATNLVTADREQLDRAGRDLVALAPGDALARLTA